MNKPFNITISVPSGNPDQLRVIEKTNRLGMALVFNRSELSSLIKQRQELGYTGVYMLVNNSTDSLPELYIGEDESVAERLKNHHTSTKKDFWEWAVIFVNRDNSLHKGHIQYIEAALIERAESNKRCTLTNDIKPSLPSLPEYVLFEADDLLDDICQITPLLGIRAFESLDDVNAHNQAAVPLFIQTKGIKAEGYEAGGNFVGKQGSQVFGQHVPSTSNGIISLHHDLVKKGVITTKDGHLIFTEDYVFSSPSYAAAIVMGRNANGRMEWRTAAGVKLKELQEAELTTEPLLIHEN